MTLSDAIAKARTKAGVSLRSLEKVSGVDFRSLHHIETGYSKEPSFSAVVKISRALKISLSKLAETIR